MQCLVSYYLIFLSNSRCHRFCGWRELNQELNFIICSDECAVVWLGLFSESEEHLQSHFLLNAFGEMRLLKKILKMEFGKTDQ